MTIPALSLIQPWASLVACGVKLHETRGWAVPSTRKIPFRMAIHASASKVERALPLSLLQLCARLFGNDWAMILPRGKILAIVTVVACDKAHEIVHRLRGEDALCGNFARGRWAWGMAEIEKLEEPIAARGALGLWEWDEGGTGAVPAPAQGRLI